MGLDAMLFAAHIDVATATENEQSRRSENQKTEQKLDHDARSLNAIQKRRAAQAGGRRKNGLLREAVEL
jgi:hypothetical protein